MGWVACNYCGTTFDTRGVEGALQCPSCGGPLRLEDGALVPDRAPPDVDITAPPAVSDGERRPARSRGLPSLAVMLALPVLYVVWVLAMRALFELKVGIPLPLDSGEVWLALLLISPLVAGMMVGLALLALLGVLHWLRATRRPSLAMALVAGAAAALMLAADHGHRADALREVGDELWGGASVWAMAEIVGTLNLMAMEALSGILAVFLSVNALLAAGIDLVRRRSHFGCWGVVAAGLHGLCAAAVLVGLGLLGARLWTDGQVLSTLHQLQGGGASERAEAAATLGDIGDYRVLRSLFTAARDDDDTAVRVAAIAALSVLGGAREADDLLDILEDRDPEVVRAVAGALVSMVARLDLGTSSRRAWASALGDQLEHEDGEVRTAAADILIALGPVSSSYAADALSAKGDARTQALRVLAEVGEEECISTLIWHLDDPATAPVLVEVTRRAGSGALVHSAFQGAAPGWHRIDDQVHAALIAVGEPGVDSLVETTCDDDARSDARAYAWRVARELGGDAAAERGIACLEASLSSEDGRTAERARYTLNRIGRR